MPGNTETALNVRAARADDLSVSETDTAVNPAGSKQWAGTVAAHPRSVGASMRNGVRQHDKPALSQDVAGEEAEQRAAPRFTLLIRSAKLTSPYGEFLCIVRDVSETGISVRLFHQLPPDIPLTLELPNGDRHPLDRVWEEEGKAGFRFGEDTNIERILESPSRFAKRAVRVNIEVPCDLLVSLRWVSATILNLSQSGAQIRTSERLSLVQRVKLRAEGMPEVAAKVRWRHDEHYGLSFEDTFQFAELAALAFDLRRSD